MYIIINIHVFLNSKQKHMSLLVLTLYNIIYNISNIKYVGGGGRGQITIYN